MQCSSEAVITNKERLSLSISDVRTDPEFMSPLYRTFAKQWRRMYVLSTQRGREHVLQGKVRFCEQNVD